MNTQIINGWLTRDSKKASNTLHFHKNKIKRNKFYWENEDSNKPIGDSLILPDNLFPEITWDSEPVEVELTIKIKENAKRRY